MRELKFRAWDGDRMQKVLTLGLNEGYVSTNKLHSDIEDFVIMQYTGLKDQNNTEIYEGDIIKITYDTNWSEHPYYIGVVEYQSENGYPAFDLNPWIDCEMNALSWLNSKSDLSVKKYEVIGNIYENPDLEGDGNNEGN